MARKVYFWAQGPYQCLVRCEEAPARRLYFAAASWFQYDLCHQSFGDMSDIFISYANEDRPQAERLADALKARGWSVWWDRSIPAGKRFDQVIDKEINNARARHSPLVSRFHHEGLGA